MSIRDEIFSKKLWKVWTWGEGGAVQNNNKNVFEWLHHLAIRSRPPMTSANATDIAMRLISLLEKLANSKTATVEKWNLPCTIRRLPLEEFLHQCLEPCHVS